MDACPDHLASGKLRASEEVIAAAADPSTQAAEAGGLTELSLLQFCYPLLSEFRKVADWPFPSTSHRSLVRDAHNSHDK